MGKTLRRPGLLFLTIMLLVACAASAGQQTALTREQYEEDFDYLWKNIDDAYAYFDQKQTDWNRVREIYRPRVSRVATRAEFVTLLEEVLEELYDFHTHLNTNTQSSPRLVPSGADIWAEWIDGRAIIKEVRAGSAAEKAGLRTGMEIVSINGVSAEEAVRGRLGKSLRSPDVSARNWALQAILAGRRNQKRSVEVVTGRERKLISIEEQPAAQTAAPKPLLEYRLLERDIGYIRINNSLGDTALIKHFDAALAALRNTRGLILDLRDTPSGGNTTVGRGIMGRFVNRDMPYQKHSIPSEERKFGTRRSWIELVSPRGDFIYRAPVVVLVNYWTGSMGEGIAIGMDAIRRGTVVGTQMARLIGATSGIRLPNTGVGVTFPTEKLFHVNGTPREDFVPPVYVDLLRTAAGEKQDIILRTGLKVLRSKMRPAATRARRTSFKP